MISKAYILLICFLTLPSVSHGKAKKIKGKSSFNTGYGNKKKSKNRRRAFSIGAGLNFPDIFPIESHWLISRKWAVTGFVVPKIPFNIRVEMPSDQISSKDGVIIEHPAFNVNFKAEYGPQIGIGTKFFPTARSFYLLGGLSYRSLSLDGSVSSSLILRTEAAPGFETNSIFNIFAKSTTTQYVGRFGVGFHWRILNRGYIDLNLVGATLPASSKSNAQVSANVTNPKAPTQEEGEALKEFKAEKETEMEEKAIKSLDPLDRQVLPLIGLTIGIYI